MRRLIILGSSGMLGSEVSRVAKQKNLNLLEVSRSGEILFDAERDSFDDVAKKLDLTSDDWLVNCIGWIPQKAAKDARENARLANVLNTKLPEEISKSKVELGFNWLQIATDCAFDGSRGAYRENDDKDGKDLYSLSKIEGEKRSRGSIQIRCSVIGPEKSTMFGLYSWLKNTIDEKKVKGYSNHFWNGVSSTAFAKLATSMFEHDLRSPMNQHWIPSDSVSKLELLRFFALNLGYEESRVHSHRTTKSVDRTLSTLDAKKNSELWRLAGYRTVPDIAELCREFIDIDKRLRS